MKCSSEIRILAVDDNTANLKLACILLEDLGLEVTPATSGERAVELAQEQRFDLILMDLQMPGLDGRAAAQKIRSQEQGKHHTPIIALTAHLLPTESETLQAAGLDDQIVKPISNAQIRDKLSRWLGAAKAELEEPTASPPPSERDQVSRIVDWELGLNLAHGNHALAEEMMNLLLTTLPRDAAAIVTAWDAKDLAGLKGAVHRLNGALRYCGVPRLRNSVEQLETCIKLEDQMQIKEAMGEFTQATDDLCIWAEFRRPTEP